MNALQERFAKQHPPLVEAILKLAKTIKAYPSARALLVGGFVRDILLDLSPTDADVEVYGVEADTLEKILTDLFPGRVNLVGRAFGVFKIPVDQGYELDVALPRRESKTGTGHKDFAVVGDPMLDPKEATRRRDFTVNAILLDPLTGDMIDPWHGQQDLKDGLLRMVDTNRFGEDPLRIYRAVQFAARFEFTIETTTFELLRSMVTQGELAHLPPERITEEWRKLLLKAKRPSIGLELMRALGIIERDYPELQAMIGVEQDPEWHPEGDVWTHTLMCLDAAAKLAQTETFSATERLQITLGTLCHDLGKPSTTAIAPKQGVMRIRSLGHEDAGVIPTETFCARLRFGEDVNQGAIVGAREHLKPGILNRAAKKDGWTETQYTNAVRKLLKRIYPVSWRVLVAISEADHRGRTLPDAQAPGYPDSERLAKTIRKHHLDESPTKPLLSGEDLATLGISPGPEMGRIIRIVEDARDKGDVINKDEAIETVKHLLKK
jgi:tRNA nucleotidyltransferase (CCA-adding enzyme)